jgi:hypothetical protein
MIGRPVAPLKGKTLAIAFLVALIGFALLVFWIGATGGGTARLPPATHDAAPDKPEPHE